MPVIGHTPWRVVEESGPSPFDLALVLDNPEYTGTDRDVRLVVTWGEADDEPEVMAVYPCRACGWDQACAGRTECHS